MKTIKVFLTNGTTVEGFLSKWTKKKLVLISNAGAKLTIYKPYKYVMMIKDISEMQVPNLLPNTQTKQQQSVPVSVMNMPRNVEGGQHWVDADGRQFIITDIIADTVELYEIDDREQIKSNNTLTLTIYELMKFMSLKEKEPSAPVQIPVFKNPAFKNEIEKTKNLIEKLRSNSQSEIDVLKQHIADPFDQPKN